MFCNESRDDADDTTLVSLHSSYSLHLSDVGIEAPSCAEIFHQLE